MKAAVLRRPPGPRRGVSPGDGVGLADRPVYRCLAQAPPRRRSRRTTTAGRIRGAPERRLHRFDQRGVRRRATLHAARLHRPGLERRGGASVLAVDSVIGPIGPMRLIGPMGMRYHALACDYDGTIAHDGRVDEKTLAALERLLASGRRLILVTGRELPELQAILP